jgi:hypothetical protein
MGDHAFAKAEYSQLYFIEDELRKNHLATIKFNFNTANIWSFPLLYFTLLYFIINLNFIL